MTNEGQSVQAGRYRFVLAWFAVIVHFFGLVTLILASTPSGAESFSEAHSALGLSIIGICYLTLFLADAGATRKTVAWVMTAVWVGMISRERLTAGILGILMYGGSLWLAHISRQFRK